MLLDKSTFIFRSRFNSEHQDVDEIESRFLIIRLSTKFGLFRLTLLETSNRKAYVNISN